MCQASIEMNECGNFRACAYAYTTSPVNGVVNCDCWDIAIPRTKKLCPCSLGPAPPSIPIPTKG